MSQIDVASNSALLSVAEKLDTQNILLTAIASKEGSLPIKDWTGVQAIVRMGFAPKVFSIGDQLVCNHEKYGELVWDIIGFDHEQLLYGNNKTHSMTIQLHSCLSDTIAYDAAEALYYAENELPAGTYNFTLLAGYDEAYGGGKTYSFTLTNSVPAGGVIVFPWGYQQQAANVKISTYDTASSTSAIESVAVTQGTNGTALESMGECNSIYRVRFGSNNWNQSAIRQFLNSDADAGSVWTPKTNFDRPPSWATDTAGFLNGLDADFLAVIGEVEKITALNTITDGGSSETNKEKFFLLSRAEVYGGTTNGILEGEAYPYYSETSDLSEASTKSNTNRIKYKNGVTQWWWLRSPYSAQSHGAQAVSTSGSISSNNATMNYGVAPACCIC